MCFDPIFCIMAYLLDGKFPLSWTLELEFTAIIKNNNNLLFYSRWGIDLLWLAGTSVSVHFSF